MTAYTGVPPIDGVENKVYPQGRLMMDSFHEIINMKKNINAIVITAQWDAYFKEDKFFIKNNLNLHSTKGMQESIKTLGKEIQKLREVNKNIYVILSVPTGSPFDPKKYDTKKL
jgi:hypothetical protein